uniref:Bcl-2 Bcl-2 homology region 1-3 domain-containing protein n=1 Tax=Canis lupus familiaris TaxID=9615 RepID=A0A8C0PFA3_CANLF
MSAASCGPAPGGNARGRGDGGGRWPPELRRELARASLSGAGRRREARPRLRPGGCLFLRRRSPKPRLPPAEPAPRAPRPSPPPQGAQAGALRGAPGARAGDGRARPHRSGRTPEASAPPGPAPAKCRGRGAAPLARVPAMEVLRRSSVLAAEIMDAFDRSPSDKELVAQAKALGREFVHARLLRAGLAWTAPERAAPAPGGRLAEVCAVLLRLGDELELIRPSVYRNVARQLNISLQSESVVTDAFLAVASQIFSGGITWGKVVSLYSVAAGLAVDCVRQAQPALVHALVDCLGEFVRKTLGALAAEARRMDRRPQVCGEHGARLPLALAGGRALQLRPLPEGRLPRAAAREMSGRSALGLKPGPPSPGPRARPRPPRPAWECAGRRGPTSGLEALP